jgi:hypothetical protein
MRRASQSIMELLLFPNNLSATPEAGFGSIIS